MIRRIRQPRGHTPPSLPTSVPRHAARGTPHSLPPRCAHGAPVAGLNTRRPTAESARPQRPIQPKRPPVSEYPTWGIAPCVRLPERAHHARHFRRIRIRTPAPSGRQQRENAAPRRGASPHRSTPGMFHKSPFLSHLRRARRHTIPKRHQHKRPTLASEPLRKRNRATRRGGSLPPPTHAARDNTPFPNGAILCRGQGKRRFCKGSVRQPLCEAASITDDDRNALFRTRPAQKRRLTTPSGKSARLGMAC